ncbi:MAG TPA: thiamine-phosphate kinase [Candidatus Acidoferrum sp.]|nr:thiamine-phosphate kinase [Candidatus Acidoferrum sp.]
MALLQKIERAARSGGQNRQNFGIQLGIGDDAALWRPRKGYETVLTTDWFLEGRHFLRDVHPPESVGWKCLSRAVSDVAAIGGDPRCCLVSLALPSDCAREWLDQYLKGLSRAARKLDCFLAGGDTTRFRAILINVSVVGEVKSGTAVKRSGARAGDRIFVSGKLGEAELGLTLLKKGKIGPRAEKALLQKHFYPTPRIALGSWLASNRLATAMMDLSDGLSSDLARLCSASGTGARIFREKLPVSGGAFARRFDMKQRFNTALHGGDDYELLFCVKRSQAARIPRRYAGVGLTEIGEITVRTGITLIDSSGNQSLLEAAGWDPFRK